MKIQYLKNDQIDIELWDACVKQSLNGFPYAYSFYLNIVAPGFSAIVLNNYEAILPLPTKKKWGVQYVYYPLLCQQLGIVSKKKLDETTIGKMVDVIPKKIKYINYCTSSKIGQEGNFTPRDNYELLLNEPYSTIVANYKYNTRRRIKKALKKKPNIVYDIPVNLIIKLIQQTFNSNNSILSSKNYIDLKYLLNILYEKKIGNSVGILDEKNELIAFLYFLKTDKRIINLLNASTSIAKKNNCVTILLDKTIEKYSNTNCIFDFEGSSIPSIAQFFRNFGAKKTVYYNWCWNRLPFPFNYLKP